MGIVFDTSVMIAAEKGTLDFKNFLNEQCSASPIFITSVTASELLHGWERAPNGKRKNSRKRFVEKVLVTYPILDFDLAAARRHAKLWATLEKKGQVIGAHDLMIAAICLSLDHQIATLNEKEFRRVRGLKLMPIQKYVNS